MWEVELTHKGSYKKVNILFFFQVIILLLIFLFSANISNKNKDILKSNLKATALKTKDKNNIKSALLDNQKEKKTKISVDTFKITGGHHLKNIQNKIITDEKQNIESKNITKSPDTYGRNRNSNPFLSKKIEDNILNIKIGEVKTYISFFYNGEERKLREKEFKAFKSCASGIPNSLLSYIILDDPKITELLKDNNNPFKEIVEENGENTNNRKNSKNNSSPNETTQESSDITIADNTEQNLSNGDSSNSSNTYGDYSSEEGDNSPVDSESTNGGNNTNNLENYNNGFIIYNNGERFIKAPVKFSENSIVLNSGNIPVSYIKYDGLFLLNNNLSIFDINGDYFSDYAIINKDNGDISIYLNFFNDFILDNSFTINKKISISTLYDLNKNGANLCAIDKGTNELLFYSIYPQENFLFKTALLNKYSGMLSDDFDKDGFDDLLLSSINKSYYLYLKNIKGREISPFLTNIPFTKPPISYEIKVSDSEQIKFMTFETKNSIEIFFKENSYVFSVCSVKSPSMDIFILISDFNWDSIPDLAVGHF